MSQFGDKFRKAREAKGISLDDVSNVTKIGSRMLQAIEEENFDILPGGVFNKGFIRAYAKHLGLNDEEAVTDYLACLRQAQIDAHEVWEAAPRAAAPEKRPLPPYTKPAMKAQPPVQVADELPHLQLPRAEHVRPPQQKYLGGRETNIPWRLVAAAAVVVILTAILWIRHSHRTPTQTATANAPLVASASTTQPAASAPTTPPAPTATVPSASHTTAPTKSSTNSAPNQNQAAPTPPSQAPSRPTNISSPAPAATPTKSPADSNEDDKNDVTTRSLTPKPAQPPTKPAVATATAATMTLIIRATETSWISVTADGQPRGQETLIAPAHTTVRANREIIVRVGNAAGVTFLWNNQEIPAQGAEAEVKTFVFDSNGMNPAQ